MKNVAVRLSQEDYDALKALADKERRSMGAQVASMLADKFSELKRSKTATKRRGAA